MSHEEKLFEVFKQLSFLSLQHLKKLSEEQINDLYETRPFKEEEKSNIPEEKNEPHSEEVENEFNDIVKNY